MKQRLILLLLPLATLLAPACSDLENCDQLNINDYERITGIDIPPVASSDCREDGPVRLTIFQLDTLTDTPWRRFGTRESFTGRYNLQPVSAVSLRDYFPALTGDPRLPTEGTVYLKATLKGADYHYKVALLPENSILILEVRKN